jgi:D-alanyl-D-alanine carboxypeptidase
MYDIAVISQGRRFMRASGPSAGRNLKNLLLAAWVSIGILVVWTGLAVAASAPAGAPPAGNLLQDKAVWDVKLFQAYCKVLWDTDVTEKVAPYPGQNLITSDFNPEFVKRLEAMISFYQARGHNDIGIVPGLGGFRTPAQQHEKYKEGRVQKPNTTGTHENDWVRPKDSPIVTDSWIGWHNFGLAADVCQYDGETPKVVAVAGKMEITLPFKSVDWARIYEDVAPDLGFIWGGWWHVPHDPGHFEWHPNRHNPAALESTGLPDPQFNDLYTSKIPDTLYMWSGDSQNSDAKAQVLYVITVAYDAHWVAVKSERRIERGKNLGWTGVWTTFDPPLRLFPGYVPTNNFHLNSSNQYMLDHFASKSTIHTTSVNAYPDKSWLFVAYEGSARFCPEVWIKDCETAADVQIGIASPTPKPDDDLKTTKPKLYNALMAAHNRQVALQNNLIAEFAAVRDTSVYDVSASVHGIDPPKDKPYDMAFRTMNLGADGYTTGNPNEVTHPNITPRGPSFSFVWVRPSGQIGLEGLAADQKSEYAPMKVVSLCVYANKAFMMVSPTLPSGAFDQATPPQWPKPNPKPTPIFHPGLPIMP